jgi:AraC-like DNA-binding protein
LFSIVIFPVFGHAQDDTEGLEGVPKDGPKLTWWGRRFGFDCGTLAGCVERPGWSWSVSSRREVWLWLNSAGEGLIWGENDRFVLKPGMFALTGGECGGAWTCLRQTGNHRLEVVRLGGIWLRERLGPAGGDPTDGLAAWLASGRRVAFCGLMSVWEKDLCAALAKGMAGDPSSRILAEARILDWAAHRLFRDAPNPATRDLRGPVKQAIQILRGKLDQALDLTALARDVGVSPHHLSRMVKTETGLTLQQHLRRLRIDHACGLLRSGRTNVTEAALASGYQSLSHFAKAFREETGSSPREWLSRPADGR